MTLNKNTMDRLSHNWLWGLQYSKIPTPASLNMSKEIEMLASNNPEQKKKLSNIINKQDSIREANIATRFFSWIFDISNYRSDYYKLAVCHAYISHLHYYPQTDHKEPPQGSSILVSLRQIASWITQSLKWEFGPNKYRVPLKQVNDELIITPIMAEQLEILGLDSNVGDALNISQYRPEIISAYRTRVMEVHPDKGGSAGELREVNDAYSELRKVLKITADAPKSSTRSITELLLSNGGIANSSPSNTHEYYYNKFEKLLSPIKKIMENSNNYEMERIINWLDAHVFSLRSVTNSDQREAKWSKIHGKLFSLAKELQLNEGYSSKEVLKLVDPMRYLLLDYSSFILDQASDALDAKSHAFDEIVAERDKARGVAPKVVEESNELDTDAEDDSTPSGNKLGA